MWIIRQLFHLLTRGKFTEDQIGFRIHIRALFYLLEINEGIVVKDIDNQLYIVSKVVCNCNPDCKDIVIANTIVTEEIDSLGQMREGMYVRYDKTGTKA